MTITTADHRLEIIKEGEEWKVDTDFPIVLDKSAVEDITYSFASLFSEKIVEEDPQDLAQYGLDPPVSRAVAHLSDGSVRELYVGDRTPARNTYYLMARDDPRVYAVWLNHGRNLQYSLDDIRDRSLPQVNLMELKYMRLDRKGQPTIEIIRRERDGKKVWNDEVEFSLSSLVLTSPYPQAKPVNTQTFDELLKKYPQLKIAKFVDDTPAEYASYGLEDPQAEIVMIDSESSLHLLLGKREGNLVYFKLKSGKAVHALSTDILEFLDVKPFDLIDKFTFIVNIDHVEIIRIRGMGRDHTLSITREKVEHKEGEGKKEDEEEEIKETFFLDGQEVEDEPFRKFYQDLLWIFLDAYHNESLKEVPELTITYLLNKGRTKRHILGFVPYNVDFYALFKNGESEYLVSREQVKKMLIKLDAFVEKNRGG
jgi:hypothetical protein